MTINAILSSATDRLADAVRTATRSWSAAPGGKVPFLALASAGSAGGGGARAAAAPKGFVVDLGSDIGTAAWWRGLGSLTAMTAVLGWVALSPAKLPVFAAPALDDQQFAALDSVSIAPLSQGGHMGPAAAPTALVQPLAEAPERPRLELVAELREIDSFGAALRRAGVSNTDSAAAADLIAPHIDIAALQPGTEFALVLGRRPGKGKPRPLEELSFRAAFDLRLDLVRGKDGELRARPVPIRIDETPLRISGMVGDSLYKSARANGVSSRVVANFIRAMSPRLNFQRNVYASDRYDIVVEHKVAETGEEQTGDLLYARVEGNGKDLEIARWEVDGEANYFLPDGRSIKEGFSTTPVPGARLSSGFGLRRHPILKSSRMHKGLDYAAWSGTAIQATAPGTVIFAGRNGGYGNQVRIRHNNGIVTSYSHMKGFASGIRSGASVKQGEKVGFVGTTGLSTGPHLHYEVHVNGRAVDPRGQDLPTGLELAGSDLAAFKRKLEDLRAITPRESDVELNKI
ncbi:M23 family metallopeptidase [Pacificimonas flava]|uniref:Peptidase, M23/M37 family n=1 Tax=Pacificimonas flava TaxID=1234595 RepID=M2U5F8_9SPHN|nr:M23 family metallopeptidase [Pacificimonas flava]EMD83257.1 Peptidase, M23/M37 family [Pacificimonas flava]MBB5279181.1 murein DD-endopeptidase MepM/ murein hydrolase activator NlpD [Pacificimonas flava]